MRVAWLTVFTIACGGGSGGTLLTGTAPCGPGLTCDSGEVCRRFAGGVDAGGSGSGVSQGECITFPPNCFLFNCSGSECAQCIVDLCFQGPATVSGRDLTCAGF
jgi:hypothetical protein